MNRKRDFSRTGKGAMTEFKMTLLKRSALAALATCFLCAFSCAKQESDDLAKAQECLDNVPQSDPEQAMNCLPYVEKYTSQQADILKCSIYMTSGGLIENKVIAAYNALKDSSIANKEAAYMAALSLDLPAGDLNAAYTKAVSANEFCAASGVPGLVYISSVIVAGTYMNKTIKDLTGSAIDINDPNGLSTAVSDMLASCTSDPPDPKCTSDLPTLGQTTITLASSYCGQADHDDDVCSKINSAVEAAGGSAAGVGQALFCYLKNMTYNGTSCQ
jgi:hypothetical protein